MMSRSEMLLSAREAAKQDPRKVSNWIYRQVTEQKKLGMTVWNWCFKDGKMLKATYINKRLDRLEAN